MIKKILNLVLAVFMIVGMFAFGNYNKVEAEDSSTAKYAVQIYGIEQDELEDGSIAGLTFGPALGKHFVHTYISHTPTGTTSSGHAHRCVHNDCWETIVRWNFQDPYVYEQCIENNCTHSVELSLGGVLTLPTTDSYGSVATGDGTNSLCKEFGRNGINQHLMWNPLTYIGGTSSGTTQYGWGASRIRAMLNGADSLTTSGTNYGTSVNNNYIPTMAATDYTESNALISAFPQVLQNNIGKRKTYYDAIVTSITQLTLRTSYDKLWLLSPNEISDNISNSNYNHPSEAPNGKYQKFTYYSSNISDKSNNQVYEVDYEIWLRSSIRQVSNYVMTISALGRLDEEYTGASNSNFIGVAPCFALDRSHIPLIDPADPDYNPMADGSFYISERGVNANNHWVDNGDNTWTYTFDVFDDSIPYWYWEEDMTNYENDISAVPGYKTIINKQGQITNISTKLGSLKISKEVISEKDYGDIYDFTITLTGNNISGRQTFSNVLFTDGIGKIKLAKGESKLIEGLPSGTTYTVVETASPYYKTEATGDTGTIVANEVAEAHFKNTYRLLKDVFPGMYNDVTLKKQVIGNGENNNSYHFYASFSGLEPNTTYYMSNDESFVSDLSGGALVEVNLAHDEQVTFQDLPATSKYQFTEDAGAYISSYNIVDNNNRGMIDQEANANNSENVELATANETVDEFEDVVVTFTNELIVKQSLKIEKQVIGLDADKLLEYEITINLYDLDPGTILMSDIGIIKADEDGLASKTFYLKDGDVVSIEDIPVSTRYQLTETKSNTYAAYELIDANAGTNILNVKDANFEINQDLSTYMETINEDEEVSVKFINTSQVILKLNKHVDGSMGNKTKLFDFDVNITYPEINATNADNETAKIIAEPQLSHDDSVEYKVPYGSTYVISEDDYSQEGYRTYVNRGMIQDRDIEGEIVKDTDITFRNINGAAVPTEIRFYWWSGSIFILIPAIWYVYKKKQKLKSM